MSPNQISMQRYRQRAAGYDRSAQLTMPLRERTIAQLGLQSGDAVVDVGTGTGLSLEPLLDRVGPRGRVLAFEQSPEMFEQAARRVRERGWSNVWLAQAAAESVQLPEPADAVLFNYVHDVSRIPAAVNNVLRQCKPGARVAMAGMKFFPWWAGPLNIVAWLKNRPYNALATDLWSPWDLVQPHCQRFERVSTQLGMGYIAWGRLHGEAR